MATKRKTISKKTRFEVFKRDSFKCQYCGASAPEAILVVDHIDPFSKGGADEMVNYITACQSCNAGKSDRVLSDTTTLQKQKAQLDELNMRRDQLEMMMQWRAGLKEISELEVETASDAWSANVVGWSLNENGLKTLRSYVKKYGLQGVLDAIESACDSYIRIDNETGKATEDSVPLAWKKVGGLLAIASLPDDERRLHYVKGILRNRLSYVPYDVIRHLQDALAAGVSVDAMQLEAKNARNWTEFRNWLYDVMGDANV